MKTCARILHEECVYLSIDRGQVYKQLSYRHLTSSPAVQVDFSSLEAELLSPTVEAIRRSSRFSKVLALSFPLLEIRSTTKIVSHRSSRPNPGLWSCLAPG